MVKRGASEFFQISPWICVELKNNQLWRQPEEAEDSNLTYLSLVNNSKNEK